MAGPHNITPEDRVPEMTPKQRKAEGLDEPNPAADLDREARHQETKMRRWLSTGNHELAVHAAIQACTCRRRAAAHRAGMDG